MICARPNAPLISDAVTEREKMVLAGDPRAEVPPRRPHAVRRVGSVLLLFAVLAAVGLAAAVGLVPRLVGGMTVTVLSGSMEPALPVGSVAIIRPRPPGEIGVGDVITFADRNPDTGVSRIVTHRVVAVEPGPAYRTRGDANEDLDTRPVPAADVRGVLWYSLPEVGRLRERVGSPAGLVAVGGLVLLLGAAHLLLPRHARPKAPTNGRDRSGA
jgi:signal peptidase